MKPKLRRAVSVGTGSPYLCYGQTGDLIALQSTKTLWGFYPDGDGFWIPVARSEFYCPAMGDDLDPSKGVNQ